MKKSSSKTLKEVISERSNDYTFLEKEYGETTNKSLLLDPFATPQYEPSKSPPVSVVIPTYNSRSSIFACLAAIEQSSFNFNYQNRLQVIVVDDGSTDGTWDFIKDLRLSLNLICVRQNHHSVAHAKNTGISVADGDIIIACDADMILSYHTIEHFASRHMKLSNVLLVGFRTNMPQDDPRVNPHYIRKYGSSHNTYFRGDERITYSAPGWPSNMCLASGHLKQLGRFRGLWMPDGDDWNDMWTLPDLVFGSLFSLSRHTYYSLGGYDERFHGWGCEDGFLAAKAFAADQCILPVYAASGLHIKHLPRSNNKQLEYAQNRKLFHRLINRSRIISSPNYLSDAKSRIVESFVHSPANAFSKPVGNDSSHPKNKFSLNDVDDLLAIGDYSKAMDSLKTSKDDDADKFIRQGKALIGLSRYKEAISILEDISKMTGLKCDPTMDLVVAKAALGQFSSAKNTLKNLFEVHPETPDLSYWYLSPSREHIRQGKKYLNQKFYSIARRCFEAALIMDPKSKIALKFREECMLKE